jgi:hypothetical protein
MAPVAVAGSLRVTGAPMTAATSSSVRRSQASPPPAFELAEDEAEEDAVELADDEEDDEPEGLELEEPALEPPPPPQPAPSPAAMRMVRARRCGRVIAAASHQLPDGGGSPAELTEQPDRPVVNVRTPVNRRAWTATDAASARLNGSS